MRQISFDGVTYDTSGDTTFVNEVLLVVGPGGVGPKGAPGDPGPQGVPGTGRGTKRWHGHGPPDVVIGAQAGDEYLDLNTGDLYTLT